MRCLISSFDFGAWRFGKAIPCGRMAGDSSLLPSFSHRRRSRDRRNWMVMIPPWRDDAPPVSSEFARLGQELRIFVQISRRCGETRPSKFATP